MGARFDLQHINLVAYLTSEISRPAPRSDEGDLREFLNTLGNEIELRRRTISTDPLWQQQLQLQAAQLSQALDSNSDRMMTGSEVAKYLDPLKQFFTGYELYALILPGDNYSTDLTRTYEDFVTRSGLDILVLMPYGGGSFVNVSDPFPPITALAKRPIALPAVVFWTKTEEAIALTLKEADEFFEKYVSFGAKGKPKSAARGLSKRITAESKRLAARTILHISDLHLGDAMATRRKHYLKQHLRRIAPTADRVVISGDLFDEPELELREIFDEFHADLISWTKKAPILIPGNHDVRAKGNKIGRFGAKTDQVVDIGFVPLVVDDDLQIVFFCFNSCEDGDFATGSVSEAQRTMRGTLFEQMISQKPAIENYERVAVVHHHPYTYNSKPTVFYERILSLLSKKEDRFVAFKNADKFLSWCGARNITLILHGHKHVPHVVKASITIRNKLREILIVGCGSTTGVENRPMCYDIVSFDPSTRKWGVAFFSDSTSDGAGFDPQNVTLDLRTELPTNN